jgi:hypothetical protein
LLDLRLSRNPVPHSQAERSVRHRVLGTLVLELLVSACRMLLVPTPAGCTQGCTHEVLFEEMRPEVIDGNA